MTTTNANGNGNGNGNGGGRAAPTMRYVAEQFIELFSDPRRHVRGPIAVDKHRHSVGANDRRAVAFCLAGATHRAMSVAGQRGDGAMRDAIVKFRHRLDEVTRPSHGVAISDGQGRKALLAYIERVRDEVPAD